MEKFKAYVVRETNGEVTYKVEELNRQFLYQGNTLIKAEYSSLNYKDMLGFKTKGGVIRHYPMIPGIDVAGEIVEDQSGKYQKGDKVIVMGSNMGVSTTGGYSEYVSVDSDWAVKVPEGMTTKEAMIYGTAGFTAAYALLSLINHGMDVNKQPHILVTGATGGVGSVSLAILKKLGFDKITALVRKDYQEEIALKLGATEVIWPEDLGTVKPLASAKWDYVVDNVGGEPAAIALTQIANNGAMSMCGNAAGIQFNTSVLPMILRGVTIFGIDSLARPVALRNQIWELLANEWNVIDSLLVNEVPFDKLDEPLSKIREGQHLGRTLVAF
ncbi:MULTISPECIES: YhdH/YhfP family quinone oxidoreductase [Globicatella]|uniref:YhdH/YhfP family quinone oxidoreductase n=1 Tax=Globicatella sulfidifaciens TaxID=136093 RepID=A0A7X8C295_9LACT|nr:MULTISPECIES: YhdH/YhfP family quinone oxidoreductase [Globicatella]NLJ17660.1 YhdH/YhfP family quinone oxidoreductase [Globicatella sulfidifaciens]WPC09319.1 YhdH/YhfP family quinone oxidoreductase [Globicatella sp. PHS-GS-PNBC-21-1553]